MAHRQEEKERRKRERLEREAAAAAAAKRKRLLQIIGGVVVAAAIVVGVVLAAAGGGDDAGRPSEDELKSAATAAGCDYRAFAEEVSNPHLASDTETFDEYESNPPTSGMHRPTPAQDGLYPPGSEPDVENWVHTLEHGRVLLQYRPGAADAATALRRVYEEPVLDSGASYHMLLMRNNSKMPFRAAAVAWRHHIGCPDARPAALDAIRLFRDRWVDKAPEFVP